jgi:hypothetical protein
MRNPRDVQIRLPYQPRPKAAFCRLSHSDNQGSTGIVPGKSVHPGSGVPLTSTARRLRSLWRGFYGRWTGFGWRFTAKCPVPVDKLPIFSGHNRNPGCRFKGQGMIIAPSFLSRLSAAIAVTFLVATVQPLPAYAAPKPKPAAPTKPAKESGAAPAKGGTGQAVKLAQFGDWTAYSTPGSKRICYALAVPKERLPKNLNRDPGYLFVSYRPDEKVRGEIAIVMGFVVKEDGSAQAVLGNASFQLAGKDSSLFVRNAAEEGAMLAAMKKGGSLVIKASSKRGNATSDRYPLAGLAQAVERAEKECK